MNEITVLIYNNFENINKVYGVFLFKKKLSVEIKWERWGKILSKNQLIRGGINAEAATRGVLWKKVFLEISQNS